MTRLASNPWPGNVRELENALRAAVALGDGRVIDARDLPASALAASGVPEARPDPGSAPAGGELESLFYARIRRGDETIYDLRKRLEREMIARAVAEAGGNLTKAARLLGMKRPRLSQLVREYGLRRGEDAGGDEGGLS